MLAVWAQLAGGIETYCSQFYKHLPSTDFKMTFFCVASHLHTEASAGIRCKSGPVHSDPLFREAFQLLLGARSRRERSASTLLHYHSVSACLSLPLARLLGMRIVVRHVGAEYERAKWGWTAGLVLRLAKSVSRAMPTWSCA